jgi:hypothetical protein
MKLGIPLANGTFTPMLALKKYHVECTAIVRSCGGNRHTSYNAEL